jgi:hypothetical protein
MRICRLFLLAVAGALVLAPLAQAKGPSKAEVNGPGLKKGVIIGANGFNGNGVDGPWGTPLGDLVQSSGYFPAVFGETPDPMRSAKPEGDLGPKYTITYTVPTGQGKPTTLHQDVYPYAKPSPVAHMASGQPIFGQTTHGGWYVSDTSLHSTLVRAGLPRNAPSSSSGDSALSFLRDTKTFAIVGVLVLLGLTVGAIRRRPGPAQA